VSSQNESLGALAEAVLLIRRECNEFLTEAINNKVEVAHLKRIAMKDGMKTLHQDSMLKVKMGLTTIEEALGNVPPDMIQ
jgi:type IV pilus assembly protein PilB